MNAQDGTQAIRRAAAILRRIARGSEASPPTLREIARTVDLPRSTTHRILKCLTETGLASYNPATRRYVIGVLSYELGLAATDQALDITPLRAAVDRIAARTRMTTFLLRRSGFEAVCLYKVDGTSVVRVIPVEVGQRRYLGIGAGATALLAELDDETVDRVLDAIGPELPNYSDLSTDTIRDAVAQTRADGCCISHGRVYASTFGIGMVVGSGDGKSGFAISIAAHAPDVDAANVRDWKSVMFEEIGRIGEAPGRHRPSRQGD